MERRVNCQNCCLSSMQQQALRVGARASLFCGTCLSKHLHNHGKCPKCDMAIQENNPSQDVRMDQAPQNAARAIVPELRRQESQNEPDRSARQLRVRNIAELTNRAENEQINICLEYVSFANNAMKRTFIKCSPKATVEQVKKLLTQIVLKNVDKYDKDNEIEILCDNKVLSTNNTMENVRCSYWAARDLPILIQCMPKSKLRKI